MLGYLMGKRTNRFLLCELRRDGGKEGVSRVVGRLDASPSEGALKGRKTTHVSWRMGSSSSSQSMSPTNRASSSSRVGLTTTCLAESASLGARLAGEERSMDDRAEAAALEGVSRTADMEGKCVWMRGEGGEGSRGEVGSSLFLRMGGGREPGPGAKLPFVGRATRQRV